MDSVKTDMIYRPMGSSGLKVSALALGSWPHFNDLDRVDHAMAMMQAARDAGVNLFDNAESYAKGTSERVMGEALRRLGWGRHEFVVTSKYWVGLNDGVNSRYTLNRKYLLEAIPASLQRFGLDYLDVVYAHRPDPHTPLAETVRAFSDAIDRGWAMYWGTSEWPADDIRAAIDLAQRHGWHAPIVDQPQYHLFHRQRVEDEYARLVQDHGFATTTWSPLASGLLTGKYLGGVPEGSRASEGGVAWVRDQLTDGRHDERIRQLMTVAGDLGGSLAQLAIAWCASHPHVASVITGASRVEQVVENMAAIRLVPQLTTEVKDRIDAIIGDPAAYGDVWHAAPGPG
ncbi:MAG: aldo/keto reductase [Nitriliruptoraceae bacterium]